MAYAVGAARAERFKNWDIAADLWEKAALRPVNAHQHEWATRRKAFCENAYLKGW
ncbi:ANR family transcriptional regulator [Shigella sonnei]|nr:ANR family transcriptional regulator [Escherichia coli]EFX1701591.1 ANR family transcriptional regulator [Shigella sonnei]EEZ5551858.1 ANR family transcriptional regulator [Escherichia coli]EFX1719054.1 ANR family transcriptional regulator [Shigella sonnei]EFX2368276.1 ANR family transcriptional regulator [Shigella sonnei]